MAFIALDRAVVPQVPFNVDPGSYAVVAHELLNGESLYTDIWDHKPPAAFVAYGAAEVVFGYTPETLVILNLILSLVSLVGIFYAGRAGFGDVFTGLWAAGLWVLLSGVFQLEGRDPNTEPFLNACIIWAFALIAANRPDGLKLRTTIAIALLFLLASFFKPIIVPVAACLTIAHVMFSADRRKALRDAAVIASVGAVGWAGMFGYFAATDRFELFYTTIISYNRFYSGSMVDNVMAPIRGEVEFFPDVLNVVAVLACLGLILTLTRSLRQAAMLLAFLGSSWIAIALPGRFSVHYYQLWLPSLIVGTSWAIGYLGVAKDLRIRAISYVMGAIVIGSVAFGEVPTYRSVYANDWTPAIPLLGSSSDTAFRINSLLKPDEAFFLWGNTPSLYLLTGRRPPAAVLFDTHFVESPVSEILTNRVKADLDKNRPELLVAESGRPPVPEWLAKDYLETPVYQDKDSYSFYVRRGGRLAAQLNLLQQ
ncbi:hypothetical protein BH10ACI2_BH10ACI2_06190 [soil metagenome]